MTALKWIQFSIGGLFLLGGLGMFLFEVIGLYHFHYVLNRMHASAMGDTLGIGLSVVGLMIFSGFHLVSLKLFLVVAILWISSPTSSHMIANLEVSTDEHPEQHYQEMDLKDVQQEEKERALSAEKQEEK